MIVTNSPKTVLFLSSGIGGLPYLETARQRIPEAVFHYLADDAGFPYGTKKPGEVADLLLERVRRIRSRMELDALVVGCNTASQIGLGSLRAANPDIPIIGTVPAVKPAAEETSSGRIGVLATERTVADPYLDDLIARYAPEAEVVKLSAQDLVDFIERRLPASSAEERRDAVMPYLRYFVEHGVDRIVLACTHFLHLQEDIAEAARKLGAIGLGVIDSREGVAAKLAEVLASVPSRREQGADEARIAVQGRFFLTSDPPFDPSYGIWAERFELSGPERL